MTDKHPEEKPADAEIVSASSSDTGKEADAIDISSPPEDRAIRPLGLEDAKKLAAAAAQVALDNNGQDVAVLDVSAQSGRIRFFRFCYRHE